MMFHQPLLTALALYLTLVSAQGDCQDYHTSCSASQYGVHECNCGGDGIVSYLSLFVTLCITLAISLDSSIPTTYLPTPHPPRNTSMTQTH
ncbi:hypothetical protein BDR22DRAFT_845014 [Usnea florida]